MISTNDEKHFRSALAMAYFGEHRVRVGAIAAIKSTRICGAFNTHRNLPTVAYPNCTTHAEMNALDGIPYGKWGQVTFYVARISKAGKTMPSKPCRRCMNKLSFMSIKYVVYFDGKNLVKEVPYVEPG